MVKVSLKSTFGVNDFPLDFCHRKSTGCFYWHADLFDQNAHFKLYQPQEWCESLPKIRDDCSAFFELETKQKRFFQ
jgi:hypothetical protein